MIPAKQYIPVYNSPDVKLAVGESQGLKISQQDTDSLKDLAIPDLTEVKRTLRVLDTIEPQKPVSQIEAEEIQQDISNMIDRIQTLKKKVAFLNSQVDSSMFSLGENKTTFNYNLSKRPRLKNAMKTIFGRGKSTITYQDYLYVLDLKQAFEKTEAEAVFEEEPYDG